MITHLGEKHILWVYHAPSLRAIDIDPRGWGRSLENIIIIIKYYENRDIDVRPEFLFVPYVCAYGNVP